MKKFLISMILTLVLLFTAYAYRDAVIDFLPIDQSGWAVVDGIRCYLDEDGDPITGWQEIEGQHYFFHPGNGAMVTGWMDTDQGRYYLNDRGHMSTGWIEDSAGRFFLSESGTMVTGWQEIDGTTYYFGTDGAAYNGWTDVNGTRCYLAEGIPVTGWADTDEGRYYLNADGSIYTGWLEESGLRCYLGQDGKPATGWTDTDQGRFYLDENGCLSVGLVATEDGTYYFNADGSVYTGWMEIEGLNYFFDENGALQTGWIETDDGLYYIKEDGTLAMGKEVIDGETYYFTSTGANIILVNPWNKLPEDYTVELVESANGSQVAADVKDALEQMLADCKAAGYSPLVVSSYRTIATQQALLDRKVREWQNDGYSYSDAYYHATQIVAVPGTSEHHLGYAVDIVDSAYTKLNYQQADRPTQKWLMENCWKYGFIMRYPFETTEITGIIYEPWHYRYVGTELSMELYELGVCLEVYLDNLTNDGTTCGGKLVIMD